MNAANDIMDMIFGVLNAALLIGNVFVPRPIVFCIWKFKTGRLAVALDPIQRNRFQKHKCQAAVV